MSREQALRSLPQGSSRKGASEDERKDKNQEEINMARKHRNMKYMSLYRKGWDIERAGMTRTEARTQANYLKSQGYKAMPLITVGGTYTVASRKYLRKKKIL